MPLTKLQDFCTCCSPSGNTVLLNIRMAGWLPHTFQFSAPSTMASFSSHKFTPCLICSVALFPRWFPYTLTYCLSPLVGNQAPWGQALVFYLLKPRCPEQNTLRLLDNHLLDGRMSQVTVANSKSSLVWRRRLTLPVAGTRDTAQKSPDGAYEVLWTNVCAASKSTCWNPNLQQGGTRR